MRSIASNCPALASANVDLDQLAAQLAGGQLGLLGGLAGGTQLDAQVFVGQLRGADQLTQSFDLGA